MTACTENTETEKKLELPEIGSKFTVHSTLGDKEFTHFQPKNDHTVKLDLSHPSAPGDHEGIWMAISDEDGKDWEKNVIDGPETFRLGILRNTAVMGLQWGAYVPYRLRGSSRPVSCIEVFMNAPEDQGIVYNHHDSQ